MAPRSGKARPLGMGVGVGPQNKTLFLLFYSAEIIFSASFNQLFHKDSSEL
jgi:hypothetical protein